MSRGGFAWLSPPRRWAVVAGPRAEHVAADHRRRLHGHTRPGAPNAAGV
jgi:hypothetical protein